MTAIRLFLLSVFSMILVSCTGSQISDYTNRSVVYAWVSVKDVPGNLMLESRFVRTDNGSSAPTGIKRLGDGYLLYHSGFEPGPVKLQYVVTQNCAGLCIGSKYKYDFGLQGKDGPAAIVGENGRGVYDLGSYRLITTKKGFLSIGAEFDAVKTQGPPRSQILRIIEAEIADPQKPLVRAARAQ